MSSVKSNRRKRKKNAYTKSVDTNTSNISKLEQSTEDNDKEGIEIMDEIQTAVSYYVPENYDNVVDNWTTNARDGEEGGKSRMLQHDEDTSILLKGKNSIDKAHKPTKRKLAKKSMRRSKRKPVVTQVTQVLVDDPPSLLSEHLEPCVEADIPADIGNGMHGNKDGHIEVSSDCACEKCNRPGRNEEYPDSPVLKPPAIQSNYDMETSIEVETSSEITSEPIILSGIHHDNEHVDPHTEFDREFDAQSPVQTIQSASTKKVHFAPDAHVVGLVASLESINSLGGKKSKKSTRQKIRDNLARRGHTRGHVRSSRDEKEMSAKYDEIMSKTSEKPLKLPKITYNVIREATKDSITHYGVESVATDYRLPKLKCSKYKAMGLPILRKKWVPETIWSVPKCEKLRNIPKKHNISGDPRKNAMNQSSLYGKKFVDKYKMLTTEGKEMTAPTNLSSNHGGDGHVDANLLRERSLIRREYRKAGSIRQYADDKAMLPSVYRDFFYSRTRQNLYVSQQYNQEEKHSNDVNPFCNKFPFIQDDACQYCDVLGKKYCSFCIEHKNREFARGFENRVLPNIENDKLSVNIVAPRLSVTLMQKNMLEISQ